MLAECSAAEANDVVKTKTHGGKARFGGLVSGLRAVSISFEVKASEQENYEDASIRVATEDFNNAVGKVEDEADD